MNNKNSLSILIPARNEEFLGKTIEDILKNKRGDTEIIVGLDGYLPNPMIPDHPDVRVLYYPESIGQRAMQNRCARISNKYYLAKADAHVAFEENFDVKMMKAFEESGDNVVMVPVMRNLWVFDWVCNTCGMRIYQGPDPVTCRNETCNFNEHGGDVKSNFRKEIVWDPKTNPQSSAYRFNKNLQFKYFPELRNKQSKHGLVETMSLQGSFFMCTRENYWNLELCDESWGSWGQQGTECSTKMTLAGGRVLCNRDTWYAHLFRTQPGFSHPYPDVGKSQQRAREISRDIFMNNKWPKQKYPLSWMLEKFWFALKDVTDPEARWTEEDIKKLKEQEMKVERPGIYSIKSRKNGKVYVGSAVNLARRFSEHLRMLHRNDHENKHLQYSWNRYGEKDFSFNIEYFCDENDLLLYEQKFMDDYKAKIGWRNMYNMQPTAGSRIGIKHSKESLDKMSRQQSGDGNGFYGKHHTPESIEKMKESHKGIQAGEKNPMYGKHHSDETKEKISISQTGKEAWNKGLTKETDERVKIYSEKQTGIPKWDDKEHPKGMLGKKHSEETKMKISESSKGILRNHDNTGKFVANPTKGIIFYTDNQLNLKIAHAVQKQLKKVSNELMIPIVSASLKPMTFGDKNVVTNEVPGYLAYFKQIIAALEASITEYVYFCEHDVLYHPSHFDFIPKDKNKFYYNHNVWKVRPDGFAVAWDANQVAELCCSRELALDFYKKKLQEFEANPDSFDRRFEPGGRDINKYEIWKSEYPNIDIRHGGNLTKSKWSIKDFRDKSTCVNWREGTIYEIPGWEEFDFKNIVKS